MTEIKMPRIGQTVDELTIVEWKKKVGDRIQLGDVLFEVETDKALLPVESYAAGTLIKIEREEGEVVKVGEVCAVIGIAGEAATDTPAAPVAEALVVEPKKIAEAVVKIAVSGERILASPAARAVLREENVPLEELRKSYGEKVLKRADAVRFIESRKISAVRAEFYEMQVEIAAAAAAAYVKRLNEYADVSVSVGELVLYMIGKTERKFTILYNGRVIDGGKMKSLAGISQMDATTAPPELEFYDFSSSGVSVFTKTPCNGASIAISCGCVKNDGAITLSGVFCESIEIASSAALLSLVKLYSEHPELALSI